MSDKKVPAKDLKEVKPELETLHARDVSMFKEWIGGKGVEQLAIDYKVSVSTVKSVSSKYKWKALKKELRRRIFNDALDTIRDTTVLIQSLLESDVKKIADSVARENRNLTKEERDHLRSMYDRMLKEVRLDEGKPTEISDTQVARVEIVLPAGAKRFGVIPPDPKVGIAESSKEDKVLKIDLNDVDYDGTDK